MEVDHVGLYLYSRAGMGETRRYLLNSVLSDAYVLVCGKWDRYADAEVRLRELIFHTGSFPFRGGERLVRFKMQEIIAKFRRDE